jgi:hypothetical protein
MRSAFVFCEPKTEVEIVGPMHLSRPKKIPKNLKKNQSASASIALLEIGNDESGVFALGAKRCFVQIGPAGFQR